MDDDSGILARSRAPEDEVQRTQEVDPFDGLIELVEEHTLHVLGGKLLPVPLACLWCTHQDLEQSLIKALVEGTVRACKKHLATCASDVKDFGVAPTLRHLGLNDSENPLHDALAAALQPFLEVIIQGDATDMIDLLSVDLVQSPTRPTLKRPSATFQEVYKNYDRIEKLIKSAAGDKPTRDGICKAMSDYLGKNVSAGLVTKVRQAKGVDRKRAPRLRKMGFVQAESDMAERRHKEAVAGGSLSTSAVDKCIDEEDASRRLREMTLSQQEHEARRLHVPLPLPEDPQQRIELLLMARNYLDGLGDLPERELFKLAEDMDIPTRCQDKQSLISSLVPILLKKS